MSGISELVLGVIHQIESFIAWGGYIGVALLMALESCNIPLPSEVILTFAGYLVHQGHLEFHLTALSGAIGCVLGSVPSYWLGRIGGRQFLEKHGRWLLITPKDLDSAEKWVSKYGDLAFFICRMLPIVRTFISLPAGVLEANFKRFVLYTFLGSWIWSYGLVYAGVYFGDNKEMFSKIWHQFDLAIITLCAVAGIWYVWKHIQHFKKN